MTNQLVEKLSIEEVPGAGYFETSYLVRDVYETVSPSALVLSRKVSERRVELNDDDDFPF